MFGRWGFLYLHFRWTACFGILQSLHSNVESDIEHIAILHDIFSTFQSTQPPFAHLFFRSMQHQIIIGDAFGPNETAGKIRMDRTGRRYYTLACLQTPGANFVIAHREKADITQQFISGSA